LLIASSGLTFGEFKFPWASALKAKLLTVSSTRFRFSYIDKTNPVKWRLCQKMFEASDAESCAQWVEQINTAIARHNTDRPSELLVFVNPFGGHRMAMSTYKHAASPVFTAAGIRATVVSTERGGHASDYIRSHKVTCK
jgi:ceramide kinase